MAINPILFLAPNISDYDSLMLLFTFLPRFTGKPIGKNAFAAFMSILSKDVGLSKEYTNIDIPITSRGSRGSKSIKSESGLERGVHFSEYIA